MKLSNYVPDDLRCFCAFGRGTLGIYHIYASYPLIRSVKRLKEVVADLSQKEASCAKYRQDQDWTNFILMHGSPHRAFALYSVRNLVEDNRQYWELLRKIWLHDAYSDQSFWIVKSLLLDPRPNREFLTTDLDHARFDALPDEFLIWRCLLYTSPSPRD